MTMSWKGIILAYPFLNGDYLMSSNKDSRQIECRTYKEGQKYLVKTVSNRKMWDTPIDLIGVGVSHKLIKILDDVSNRDVLRYVDFMDSTTEAPNCGFEWVYMEIPEEMPFRPDHNKGCYFSSFDSLRRAIRKLSKHHSTYCAWHFTIGSIEYKIKCFPCGGTADYPETDGEFNNYTVTEII